MAKNHHSWGNICGLSEKALQNGGLYEFNPFDHLNAKVEAIYQNIENLSKTHVIPATPTTLATRAVLFCEIYGINRHTDNDFHMILNRGTI